MQLQCRWLDIPPECQASNDDAHYIHNVVPISRHIAEAASLYTAILLSTQSTGEGLASQQRTLEIGRERIFRIGIRDARRTRKEVHGLEDKESGKCST